MTVHLRFFQQKKNGKKCKGDCLYIYELVNLGVDYHHKLLTVIVKITSRLCGPLPRTYNVKSRFCGRSFVFNCQCHKKGHFEYCDNCLQIRYILNFVANKVCISKVPDLVKKNGLNKNLPGEFAKRTFFYFCEYKNMIDVTLDRSDFEEIRPVSKFGK